MGKMVLNGKEYVGGENWHKYSTSERVIGEWIDGKPLYQKTVDSITFSLGSDTSRHYSLVYDTSSWNIDEMISINGWWDDGGTLKELNTSDLYSMTLVFQEADKKLYVITTNLSGTPTLKHITFLYTKTTD